MQAIILSWCLSFKAHAAVTLTWLYGLHRCIECRFLSVCIAGRHLGDIVLAGSKIAEAALRM